MRLLLIVFLGLTLAVSVRSEGPPVRQAPRATLTTEAAKPLDEADLLSVDNDRLLGWLQARSMSDKDPLNLNLLLPQLGSNEFAEREDASARLVALGRIALPGLRAAEHDKDPEIANRARACVKTIEAGAKEVTSGAVVRRVLQRQPKDGIAALIRYLPFEPDQAVVEEIYFGLSAWKEQEGKVDSKLVEALADPLPTRRALAGCLVGRSGEKDQWGAVVRLLKDVEPEVRLRAAQGLLAGKHLEPLPILIALLDQSPLAIAWQAEELLHYAAGQTAPAGSYWRGNTRGTAEMPCCLEKVGAGSRAICRPRSR